MNNGQGNKDMNMENNRQDGQWPGKDKNQANCMAKELRFSPYYFIF